ncbi:hypothetical protein P3T73_05590 [Kiritimatiellota bacterium B12222]|nr:hypothetical protein P3T73_05590 [Kiritimatiellota bacterium B12222]
MKWFVSLLLFLALPAFSQNEEVIVVTLPEQFPHSQVNRSYEKDGRDVISFFTKLSYEQAREALATYLGPEWSIKVPTEQEAQKKKALLSDDNLPFVGMDAFISETHPDIYVTIAQVLSSAGEEGYSYIVTLSMGPHIK